VLVKGTRFEKKANEGSRYCHISRSTGLCSHNLDANYGEQWKERERALAQLFGDVKSGDTLWKTQTASSGSGFRGGTQSVTGRENLKKLIEESRMVTDCRNRGG